LEATHPEFPRDQSIPLAELLPHGAQQKTADLRPQQKNKTAAIVPSLCFILDIASALIRITRPNQCYPIDSEGLANIVIHALVL
jgi:hypothetical protein